MPIDFAEQARDLIRRGSILPHSTLVTALEAAYRQGAREQMERDAEIAMVRCRLLNGDASAQNRAGRPEMAERTELKADQCGWVADAIRRQFEVA